MLDLIELMGYLQWEGLAMFIGLPDLLAAGVVSLKGGRWGTCPTYPTTVVPTIFSIYASFKTVTKSKKHIK
jgi:hypothetical protein